MGAEAGVETKPKAKAAPRLQKFWKILTGVAVLLVIGFFIGVWLAGINPAVKPPKHITEQASFPIYIPQKLPGHYVIDKDSFAFNEEVLIFQATDGAGGTIAFTEQKKPAQLNFEEFYNTQIKDGQTISGVPYPSVYGVSTTNGAKVLSIVTDEVWVLASSKSPLSKEDLQAIARHLEAYKEQ